MPNSLACPYQNPDQLSLLKALAFEGICLSWQLDGAAGLAFRWAGKCSQFESRNMCVEQAHSTTLRNHTCCHLTARLTQWILTDVDHLMLCGTRSTCVCAVIPAHACCNNNRYLPSQFYAMHLDAFDLNTPNNLHVCNMWCCLFVCSPLCVCCNSSQVPALSVLRHAPGRF